MTEKPTKTDNRIESQCLECGNVFKVGSLGQFDPQCPKCHSVDIIHYRLLASGRGRWIVRRKNDDIVTSLGM